jgi:pyruvate dehydrogenase E2 component (dihydrolipoamide acetyltransferase)
MKTFVLPDLGEGLLDAEIVAWHVTVGDHVVADQPLVSVETDKAVVEVPSPRAGRIEKLCAATGERIKVGAPLVEFEEGTHPDTGTVVGELASPIPASSPVAAPTPQPIAATVRAAPAVRARARELGIDLSRVTPSGPGGAVTTEDVEAAAAGTSAVVEELKGVRRAMALNMRRSGDEVVPATVSDDADIGDWPPAEDITIRLVRAVAAGCRAAPALNAWYDGTQMERRLHTRVDLGIAVDTADGLIVPVLRDVGRRNAADLRRGLDALTADVRSRKVPLAELRGQTITLSNFGTLAGRYAALAIVPPQVAILGAGRARPAVRPVGGQAAVRRVLPLSLTFDHRVVAGGEAARFLQAAIADLEQPA